MLRRSVAGVQCRSSRHRRSARGSGPASAARGWTTWFALVEQPASRMAATLSCRCRRSRRRWSCRATPHGSHAGMVPSKPESHGPHHRRVHETDQRESVLWTPNFIRRDGSDQCADYAPLLAGSLSYRPPQEGTYQSMSSIAYWRTLCARRQESARWHGREVARAD